MKVVTAKCVGCGTKREIKPSEVPNGDVPYCNQCGMPMVVHSVKSK